MRQHARREVFWFESVQRWIRQLLCAAAWAPFGRGQHAPLILDRQNLRVLREGPKNAAWLVATAWRARGRFGIHTTRLFDERRLLPSAAEIWAGRQKRYDMLLKRGHIEAGINQHDKKLSDSFCRNPRPRRPSNHRLGRPCGRIRTGSDGLHPRYRRD